MVGGVGSQFVGVKLGTESREALKWCLMQTELIQQVRDRLRVAQSRQKSYDDQCRLDLEF